MQSTTTLCDDIGRTEWDLPNILRCLCRTVDSPPLVGEARFKRDVVRPEWAGQCLREGRRLHKKQAFGGWAIRGTYKGEAYKNTPSIPKAPGSKPLQIYQKASSQYHTHPVPLTPQRLSSSTSPSLPTSAPSQSAGDTNDHNTECAIPGGAGGPKGQEEGEDAGGATSTSLALLPAREVQGDEVACGPFRGPQERLPAFSAPSP
ncbi:hypothetical protein IAT38_003585 [Cryptococcus sp. DSM 104549]